MKYTAVIVVIILVLFWRNEQEYVTLSNLEIEENVIGSSNLLYAEPEQEYNLIGLHPTIEMPQEQQTIDQLV